MAAEQPCVLPERYKDWESFLAELPDAIATQKPEFYALKLVALNGRNGGNKDTHDIAATVNADLNLEFTDDYFGPAKVEQLAQNPDSVIEQILESTNKKRASSLHPLGNKVALGMAAAAALITTVAVTAFGWYHSAKNTGFKSQEPEQHLLIEEGNAQKAYYETAKYILSVNEKDLRPLVDRGGMANHETVEQTHIVYNNIDTNRKVPPGTTFADMRVHTFEKKPANLVDRLMGYYTGMGETLPPPPAKNPDFHYFNASNALKAMRSQEATLRPLMEQGGAASANPTIRNKTLAEYTKIDVARGQKSGTTYREFNTMTQKSQETFPEKKAYNNAYDTAIGYQIGREFNALGMGDTELRRYLDYNGYSR